jgi:hypothetical protein
VTGSTAGAASKSAVRSDCPVFGSVTVTLSIVLTMCQPDPYVLRAMADAWLTADEARRVKEKEGISALGHKGQTIQHPAVRAHGTAQDRFLRLRRTVLDSPLRPNAPERAAPDWRTLTRESDCCSGCTKAIPAGSLVRGAANTFTIEAALAAAVLA